MKIEKISDTQIKFILSKEDLIDRDIKLDELSSPSDKTQDLFRDIMEQAMEECDFIADDAPLMVEAVPVALDGIMIIVTKLEGNSSTDNKFTLLSQSKDARRYKRKSVSSLDTDNTEDSEILVYSFAALDDAIEAALRIKDIYFGTNELYKMDGRFFLMLQNDMAKETVDIEDLSLILNEYGQKHISSVLSKYYLVEHGELIVKNPAVKILAKNFC